MTRLRVSSSRNAAPSRKKCGLKRRTESPAQRAEPMTSSVANNRIITMAAMNGGEIPGWRRYGNGQASVGSASGGRDLHHLRAGGRPRAIPSSAGPSAMTAAWNGPVP